MHTRIKTLFKAAATAALLALAVVSPAAAQSFDNTGNRLLQGTYYFREVIWLVGDNSGNLSRAISAYGNVSFDGNGNYSLTSQVYDSDAGSSTAQSYSTTGTYTIGAAGFGFLANPLSTGDFIYASVGQGGILVGSTTEGGFNDMFVAAPVSTAGSANSSFQGSYSVVDVDFPTGGPADTRDSQLTFSADGSGGIGTVTARGYIGGRATSLVTQTLPNVRYSVSNGASVVFLGGSLTSTNLVAGNKYLYISADGNFVFGGSPTGFDFMVGVRSPGTAPSFNGLYYTAGVYQDVTSLASAGYGDLDTYYGAAKASNGTELVDQRLLSPFQNNALDFTYADNYSIGSDGTYTDAYYRYTFNSSGTVRVGLGTNNQIGINVAVLSPTLTQNSSVYINPTGVLNAASSAPFTAGISAGELITIYGNNLSSQTTANSSFPLTLGGVQVLINNRSAPIYSVSPNQISVVVPFATTETIAAIEVINNGTPSNIVTEFVNTTTPGIFTIPSGGVGSAAALHADGSLVSSSNPAQPGETISVYLTGLGAVSPTINDGTPGPSSPLSTTSSTITAYINGASSTISFAGIAPGLVGLYQINLQVPTGTTSGTVTLDINGPDAYTSQATLPVGTGVGINAVVRPNFATIGQSAGTKPALRARATKALHLLR